MLAMQHLKFT